MNPDADNILDELHQIREENYKLTKGTDSEKWAEESNKRLKRYAKKFNLKIHLPRPIVLKKIPKSKK